MQDLGMAEIEDINRLISRGFFSMAFQPIMHTVTSKPFGFEALLRGPAGTPLAEPCRVFGSENVLGDEMLARLDKACIGSAARTGRVLAANHLLFINVNGNTLRRLSSRIFLNLLSELNVSPKSIVLEISERTSSENADEICERLAAFRAAGVRVALDDVGLHRPWLWCLLLLEPDFLKIDRALVTGIHSDTRKRDIVHGLSLFAEKVGATLIAEGIEVEEEHAALAEIGIPYVQGYHYGRPQPAGKWADICGTHGLGCPAILGYNGLNKYKD